MSLVDLLKDAENKGFDKRERHEIAWAYHKAVKQYESIEKPPAWNKDNLGERLDYRRKVNDFALDFARAYMNKTIDEWQEKEVRS